MVQLGHTQRNTTRAVAAVAAIAALGLAIAIATTLRPAEVGRPAGPAAGAGITRSWNLNAALTDGPVAGMPRSTFESLVADGALVRSPTLTDGPVAGMPRSTFGSLVAGEAAVVGVPTLADSPVPGMPQSTYESLVRSSTTDLTRPSGMPDSVWDALKKN